MIYKIISQTEDGTVFARIDDDGKCRVTCSEDNPDFQTWVAEGNTPLPADE